MLRDLRAADAPRLLEFMKRDFPQEEALLGTRPEGFAKIVRRVFRWDTRFLLGLARALGRPVFRFLVVEDGGQVVATTLLTFSARAGYLSMVVVDPQFRGRGYARRLLEEARRLTTRRGRPFVVLDVLESNAPARALYQSAGYRRLRSAALLTHDHPDEFPGPLPLPVGIRPFRPRDATEIAAIAARLAPTEVAAALPVRARDFAGSRFVNGLLATETASWVIDRGRGVEGFLGAGVSPSTEAANLATPVIGETVEPTLAAAFVRTGASWAAARHPTRILTTVPEENRRGRAALEEAGFHEALSLLTLSRPSA